MKNLSTILATLALFFLFTAPLHATFSLRVGDPRTSWSTQQGTIESAVLSVRPMGLYYEYGLYLTFSARGTSYKPTDSLEVTFKFDLPEGAIVHDSWLWIYNDIVRAQILDRWTASSIYEGIVQRRQDPSILFKNSPTQYELKVFPMRGDEVRKVKITYLMPADWSRETVEAELPIQILKTSKIAVSKFQILTWPNADWKNPELVDQPNLVFEALYDSVFGSYSRVDIPTVSQVTGLRFSFESPLKKGPYITTHQNGQSGFYQLAVLPSALFEHEAARKIAVLVDYEALAGSVSAAVLLQELRRQFLRTLSPSDSFNIIVSALSPKAVSSVWLSADSLNIVNAFQSAGTLLANYSNLAPLLATGIDFIKNNGNDGAILLASNASQYGNYTTANLLISDLMPLLGSPAIPVHTLNYNNSNSPYYYIGGQLFYGNDYFFVNISKLSGAASQTVRGTTVPAVVASAINKTGAALRSYDFHTTLASGYCYGRFMVGAESEIAFLNKPILQVGKFQGDFPFKIQLAGELNDQFVSADLSFFAQDIGLADTLTREMWYGNYIRLLEQEISNTTAINEMVFTSVAERVLSRYTAFLCLEDTTQLCPTCEDESQLTSTSDPGVRDSLLTAWPNPFVDRVTIVVRTDSEIKFAPSASLEIYSTTGQLLRQFPLRDSGNQQASVVWDGRDQSGASVPTGVYIALARINNNQNRVLKLVRRR